MSGITIPGRIPTPLLSHLNYRRNYGVCIVKRGRPAQCLHARESYTERKVCLWSTHFLAVGARWILPLITRTISRGKLRILLQPFRLQSDDNVVKMVAYAFKNFTLCELRWQSMICTTFTRTYGVERKSRETIKHRMIVDVILNAKHFRISWVIGSSCGPLLSSYWCG